MSELHNPIRKSRPLLRWVPRWFVSFLMLLAILAVVAVLSLLGLGAYFFHRSQAYDLREVSSFRDEPAYFDADNRPLPRELLRQLEREKAQNLPPFLVKALTAREDTKFFEHGGIDWLGIGRATLRNLRDRRYTQGASTLTMQLAKNTFEIREKSLKRKALEMVLTKRIEAKFTKMQILESYLNRIYFGAGCYGIGQASRIYFSRELKDLNEGEWAMLVGIIRGPYVFSPFRNLALAQEQRDQVLQRMVDESMISAEEKARISQLPIRVNADPTRARRQVFLQDMIRRELDEVLDEVKMEDESGLQIFTTIQPKWQQQLEQKMEATWREWEKFDRSNAPKRADFVAGNGPAYLQHAAVTLDSKSGALLALLGSRDAAVSGYDRSKARRELGSVVSPFLTTCASERGKLILAGQAVQTGRLLGIREFTRLLKRFGFDGPFGETEELYRGNLVASPMELAVGLATISNGGSRPKPYLIREIRSAAGSVLYQHQPRLLEVFSRASTQDGIQEMSKQGASFVEYGTSVLRRDAWMLRVGPQGSTVIWAGFDQPREIATSATLQDMLEKLAKRLAQ